MRNEGSLSWRMKRSAGLVALGLLVASVSGAMSVETSRKPEVDYSTYRTYAWRTRPGVDPNHPLAKGSPLDRKIRGAADAALAANGMEMAGDEPDLWITYTGYVEDTLIVEGTKRQIAEGVSWIGEPHAHSMRAHQQGTLVIEIFDARTEVLVWTGWATEVATSLEKLRKKAEKASARILKHFPPR